jgi:hypothetical protein
MAAVGGPLESITINGRTFSVAQDSGATIDLGGDTNTIEMNGDRTARMVKEVRPFMNESINVAIDHDNDDLQFLTDIQNGFDFVPVSLTLVEGSVYSGEGTITDPVVLATDKATAEVKMSGLNFTKQ